MLSFVKVLMSFSSQLINKVYRILYFLCNRVKYGSLGKNTFIRKPILVSNKKNIFLGSCVSIKNNARLEPIIEWRGCKFTPSLIIEDNTVIEQGVHINCAKYVIIHKDCLISSYVYISDIDHEYRDVNLPILFQPLLIQPVEIGEQTFIGTGVKVLAGSHIGKHCVIGANSVITHDIPDYSVAVGIPAKIIKQYDFQNKVWVEIK